jgi:hypothetical protein
MLVPAEQAEARQGQDHRIITSPDPMDKNILIRELQILLEAINEQFEIIREYEDFIPTIEFDMIMDNVRKLYETFHRLERLNDPLFNKGIRGNGSVGPEALERPEILATINPAGVPAGKINLAPESKPETPPDPIPAILKKENNPKQPSKIFQPDLFTSGEPAFSIRLKEAREKTLGPKISRHESFKASIGINDKFTFINELFDGNLREYNESIETLGGFTTLPQAQEYLDLLRRRNNWNSASNAFKRINELVGKRF